MTPDSEQWDKLQALFHLAEASPGEDLDQLLQRATDDDSLRARARALIEASRRADVDVPLAGTPPLHGESGKMGPYTIVRHLGTGGIGSVYLVERMVGGAIQRTALKVLSRSAGGEFFAERFAREQYILASLQHENITRMLDAGISESGQPYLVMEYVDGVHLDRYCDERKLDVAARLRLFLEVCQAISYAHQNLVVHLDLKPSNILVAAESGTVKVLDFGTSKLIQPDSLLTTTVMATPAYASPEQLLNEPVTTVCDVYALGAILFELLSGRRPNQDSSVALLIERSLKEFPPEPITENLSEAAAEHRGLTQTRLRSLLNGDLATIVSKCLNPRPKDRYATVDALIDDVRRYLEGRPIQARPQTTTYRLGKFVRRNRVPVLFGSIALLALVAALGYGAWRQQQAVREARRALQMQNFLQTLFQFASPEFTGKPEATVPELLANGVRLVPAYIQDPADLRAAQLSLARAMESSGDYSDALPALDRVIANSKSAHDLADEAMAESVAGNIDNNTGKEDLGKPLAEHSLALINSPGLNPADILLIQVLYAQDMENNDYRTDSNMAMIEKAVITAQHDHVPDHEVASALRLMSNMLSNRNRQPESATALQRAADIYAREPNAACDQTLVFEDLALGRNRGGDRNGALALQRAAYAKAQVCAGEGSLFALQRQSFLAGMMLSNDQAAEVAPMLEASMPRWRAITGPDSDQLAVPLLFLARSEVINKQYAAAERNARDLLRVQTGRANPHSSQMAACYLVLAQALAGQNKNAEALQNAARADEVYSSQKTLTPTRRKYADTAHALVLGLRARPQP